MSMLVFLSFFSQFLWESEGMEGDKDYLYFYSVYVLNASM